MKNDEYIKERNERAEKGEEYSREWYDSNGFPYPISGVGTDNTMAPWLIWCDECEGYHLQNDHRNRIQLQPEDVVGIEGGRNGSR